VRRLPLRRSALRRPRLARLVGPGLAVVAGLAALLVVASAAGWLQWGAEEDPFRQPPGTVAVPIALRPIPPYKRLALEDLIDPRSNRPAYIFLPPEGVRGEVLLDLAKIVGRVLSKEKPAGFAFTERDFAPVGTTPGIAAGIPPGKRAMRVDITRVTGLEELRPGDRFDLLATVRLDLSGMSGDIGGIQRSDAIALDPALANWAKQATVEVIVQNGVLVEPVKTNPSRRS
jgi:Flp pilus assembly protein CpaB